MRHRVTYQEIQEVHSLPGVQPLLVVHLDQQVQSLHVGLAVQVPHVVQMDRVIQAVHVLLKILGYHSPHVVLAHHAVLVDQTDQVIRVGQMDQVIQPHLALHVVQEIQEIHFLQADQLHLSVLPLPAVLEDPENHLVLAAHSLHVNQMAQMDQQVQTHHGIRLLHAAQMDQVTQLLLVVREILGCQVFLLDKRFEINC